MENYLESDRPYIEDLDALPFVSKVYKEHGVDPKDYFLLQQNIR